MANPVVSLEEAKASLRPHYRTLKNCIDDGYQQLVEYPKRHTLDARAQACFANSAIVHNALAAFSSVDGVKPIKGGNTFFIVIGAEINARFKKLDGRKRYRNLMTTRQLQLQQQCHIPGILPGTYLTLGYVSDPLQQRIARHLVTLQVGKKVHYEIDIDEELAGTVPLVMTMPVTPAQDTSTKRRRVQPRQQPITKPKFKGTSAGQE
ncbi:MAG: hypothetical protein WCE73_02145 [Candidatus Angelobacter sp.]